MSSAEEVLKQPVDCSLKEKKYEDVKCSDGQLIDTGVVPSTTIVHSKATVECSTSIDRLETDGEYKREGKDFSSMTIEDRDANVIRQLEYYFGDQNLMNDRFLNAQIRDDTDGWVNLELLLTFKLLKAMGVNVAEIENALSKSPSTLLEVKDGKVRRRICEHPLVTNMNKASGLKIKRTLFVDGFPYSATEREIKEFFVRKAFTDDVQLRRDSDKNFLGSVFVCFVTEAAKKHFVDKCADASCYFVKGEQRLKVKSVEEFFENGGPVVVCKKDKLYQKFLTAEQQKKECSATLNFTEGSVLYIGGLPESCTREILKEKFSDTHKVFADFDRGDTQAWLRFPATVNSARVALQQALEKQKDSLELVLNDEIAVKDFRVLEGDEEKNYWTDVERKKQEYFKNCKRRRNANKQHRRRDDDDNRNHQSKRRKRSEDQAGQSTTQ